MCYNCGCHNPHDDMGSPDNIYSKTFEDLSQKLGKTPQQIKETVLAYLQNSGPNPTFDELFNKAAKAWGQSVDEAKANTLSMLKEEIKR